MKNVLVLSYREDPHADSICRFFNEIGTNYFRVHTEELSKNYSLTFDSRDLTYKLEDGRDSIKIDSSWNIWNRRVMSPDMRKDLPKDISSIIDDETERMWEGLLMSHQGKVVNKPHNQYYANNKINQIRFASQFGDSIHVPDTLITNNPDYVKEFYEKHNGNICFKLHKGAVVHSKDELLVVYTNKITEKHMENIDLVTQNPCFFQEYIDKDFEIRIVTTEKDSSGVAIHSQESEISKEDFRRYDDVPYEYIELPRNVRLFCSNMLNNYGLKFGVFDFIYSKNGEYVFLELNPNGQWLWLEHESGYNLTEKVARNLLD